MADPKLHGESSWGYQKPKTEEGARSRTDSTNENGDRAKAGQLPQGEFRKNSDNEQGGER